MHGVRSLLMVEKLLMNDLAWLAMQPAISSQQCFFSSGIHKLIDDTDTEFINTLAAG